MAHPLNVCVDCNLIHGDVRDAVGRSANNLYISSAVVDSVAGHLGSGGHIDALQLRTVLDGIALELLGALGKVNLLHGRGL